MFRKSGREFWNKSAASCVKGCMSTLTWDLRNMSLAPEWAGSTQSHSRPKLKPGHRKQTVETMQHPASDPRSIEIAAQVTVQRCIEGDSGAWTELVKTHHRRVYALCYRFTGSASDAEDLTQDVFLKVYGNLSSFKAERGSFETWITTLTRNLLVDHFRRSKQQRATWSMDEGWSESDEQPLTERLAQKGPNQHDCAVQKELEQMVQEALVKLSPELREAVILRDLQDMDYKEIAQVLRVPEGTVKSRISRGRAELARVLERNKGQVV